MIKYEEKLRLAIFTGIGIFAGITSIWINYLIFKTGTLFGLSLSYAIIGLLTIFIASFMLKSKKKIKISLTEL